MTETGITHSVITSTSAMREIDVVNKITVKKVDAVLNWIEKKQIQLDNVLIFGAYLTGAEIASRMCRKANVTVVDIYQHLSSLIDCRVDFFTDVKSIPCTHWSLIIDTTGLGGVDECTLSSLSCDALVIEDPCSDASDTDICSASTRLKILKNHPAEKKGLLVTSGLNTKTSGTMTMTVAVMRQAAVNAEKSAGTLYAVSSEGFPERILFKEQNIQKFYSLMKQPALIISSLNDADADSFLLESVSHIGSKVTEVQNNDSC